MSGHGLLSDSPQPGPEGPGTGKSVLHALLQQARESAQHPALVFNDKRLSYAELLEGVEQAARCLAEQGVRRGDRVVCTLPSGVAHVCALFGSLALGAVWVPLSHRSRAQDLASAVDDLQPTLVLTQAHESALQPNTASRRSQARSPIRDLGNAELLGPDLAAIIYTSGSRAQPKGVMLSHGNLLSAARGIQARLPLHAADRVLCALPLTHTYGLMQLLTALGNGATVLLQPAASLGASLLDHMAREGATVLPATPSLLSVLLPRPASHLSAPVRRLTSLRWITCAADHLPEPQAQQLRLAWPQAQLMRMYGLTECIRASMPDAGDLTQAPLSVGRGMPQGKVWLVDSAGHRLPPGNMGELVVQGPHVMQGYWRRPDETALALRPDRDNPGKTVLHTGDVFTSDAQGRLRFAARRGDIIKSAGEKISPLTVQDALLRHPAVAEAAVIGVPDVRLGQRIAAYVVLRPGLESSVGELMDHARGELLPPQRPHHMRLVDQLPRNALGKLMPDQLPRD